MKTYFTTLILFILFSGYSYSQTDVYQVKNMMDFMNTYNLKTGNYNNELTETDIEGSPYLNDSFIDGTVYTTLKQQFVEIPLRYNIYNDEVEFKTGEDQILALATPDIIEKLEFGEYKMIYCSYTNSKKIKKGYFLVLEDGNASLLEKREMLFKMPTIAGAYKKAEPAKFVKKPNQYYIRVGLNEARLINGKKDLIKVLSEQKEKTEAFIKENKIKPKDPESLKNLIQYFNTL